MTKIYSPELSNIHEGATIGSDCVIHSHVWIGEDVKIGNRVKIQAYTFIPNGVTIEDDVFIGPRVTFTNDKKPPSDTWSNTYVCKGAAIGACATILPGVRIGVNSMVGAGAVVTKNVMHNTTVVGVPAKEL